MVAVRRLVDFPIISPGHLGKEDYDNINGPSLIKVPEWLPRPLGKYYLYFAHHNGQSIRLAYANNLQGPWTVYAPGTLQLTDAPGCTGHIASPDVHVDHAKRQIRMYFHGVVRDRPQQRSFVAYSGDGINFVGKSTAIADFYLRVVKYGSVWIGMSKGGVAYISTSPDDNFQRLPVEIFPMRHPRANAPGDVRHVALHTTKDRLWIYFTKIGDAPEQILKAGIDLSLPIREWRASASTKVLRPEQGWEGATLPLKPSVAGAAHQPENALRDPAIFEEDGKVYLLYSVAGESGIGIAELFD